jgi:Ser/Thr protein kinase RdoA (MazF antagonist)
VTTDQPSPGRSIQSPATGAAGGQPTIRTLAALARTALAAYGVKTARVRRVGSSFNTVLHVVTTDGRHLSVRISPKERIHPEGSEEAEADWLDCLADAGAMVKRALRTTAGRASVTVESPGVPYPRSCMVFEWSPGQMLRERVTAPLLVNSGRLLAQLHEIAALTGPPIPPHGVPICDRIVYFSVADRLRTLRAQYGTLFDDARARAESTLSRIWRDQSTSAHLVHGDFTPSNIVVNRSKVTAIDFQDMVWAPEVIDISVVIAVLGSATDHAERIAAFRRGYEQRRLWPEVGANDMEDLIAARRLSVTNLNVALGWPNASRTIERHAEMLRIYMHR